jgi:hypothetical protein
MQVIHVALAARPYHWNTQPLCKTCFKVHPAAVAGKVSDNKT